MQLTFRINQEFTVELDGESLRREYNWYRENYPSRSDTEILEEIYRNYNWVDMEGEIYSSVTSYSASEILHAEIDLTEDQFVALAREELGLGEDLADGLHGMFDFAKVPPENH